MQNARVDQVVALIEQAVHTLAPPVVLATDADGTIWSGDVGVDAFEVMVQRKAIRPQALSALQSEARNAGLPLSDDPNEVAETLYIACEAGSFSEERTYEMMAWAFAGWTADEVRFFTREVLSIRALTSRLHKELREVIDGTRSLNLPLYVVSASPTIVVQESVELAGLNVAGVIAAQAAVDHGIFQPRMAEPLPFGPGKVRALQMAVPGASVAAAFGDNFFDFELLRLAVVPIAIRPKPKLRGLSGQLAAMMELAEM
jgi:phosphoserine phosphatase